MVESGPDRAKRRFWGWGVEGAGPTRAQQEQDGRDDRRALRRRAARRRSSRRRSTRSSCRAPRVAPPDVARAPLHRRSRTNAPGHTYGKSFRDVWRALHRDFSHPPDLVAIPRDEDDVVALLDWCSDARVAAIPYGGGSSVVGGVECDVDDDYRGAVSIDLRARSTRCSRSTATSRAARIQAGIYGPALEDQLRPHGLTLRHFPQSFEFSTLGGWLATRSGGHYATLHTHIDDFVESIRAVTPRGVWESRRLPGSGAGPSPDRMLLGSEGTLGVITEAWMRLQDRPTFRASATARFSDVRRRRRGGARDLADRACTRRTAGCSTRSKRSSPAPTTRATRSCCSRSSRPTTRSTRGSHARSSARATTAAASTTTRSSCATTRGDRRARRRGRAAGATRSSARRTRATRSSALGVISETFETACTWDAFDALHDA